MITIIPLAPGKANLRRRNDVTAADFACHDVDPTVAARPWEARLALSEFLTAMNDQCSVLALVAAHDEDGILAKRQNFLVSRRKLMLSRRIWPKSTILLVDTLVPISLSQIIAPRHAGSFSPHADSVP